MSAALERRTGGQLACIILPDRLHGTDQQLQAICERLAQALGTGTSVLGPDPCTIEYREFPLTGSGFETTSSADIGQEEARQSVERAVGLPIKHAVTLFAPRSGLVMIAVVSRQSDAMMGGLVRQLRQESSGQKRQVSGKRPGVVCVKFLDVTQPELLEIVEQDRSEQPSALKLATSYLLGRDDWAPISTRSPTSRLAIGPHRELLMGRLSRTQSGKRAVRTRSENPHNAMVGDSRYSIF